MNTQEFNPAALEGITQKLTSDVEAVKTSAREIKTILFQRCLTMLKLQIETGKFLLAKRQTIGKQELRRLIIANKTDLGSADRVMKLAAMKIDFEDIESVIRALKVINVDTSDLGPILRCK